MRNVVPQNLAVHLAVVSLYSYEVIIRSVPGYLGTRPMNYNEGSFVLYYEIFYGPDMRCRLMHGRPAGRLRSSFCAPAVLCLLHYRSTSPVSAVPGIEIFNFTVCNIPGCVAVRRVHYVTISALLLQGTLRDVYSFERYAIKSNAPNKILLRHI